MHSLKCDSSEVTLARDELYRQVWQEPLTKLAPLYGLSDVGLAKVCDRFEIPRPPVGYWAKLSHGHKVKTKPLPKLDDGSLQEIRLFRHNFDSTPADSKPREDKVVVTVPERLTQPHPLVAKSKSQLCKEKAGENGLVQTSSGALDICVSPKMVGRSLRILDALIKKWEELGGKVTARERHDCAVTIFGYGDDTIAVELFEETKRYELSPQKHRYWKEWAYKPTGRLVLNIPGYGDGLRKRWADGKKQRLEEVLGSFIKGLYKWIDFNRIRRLDNECEARQRERAEKVRHELKRQKDAELERREDLEQCADSWEKSVRIRGYLAAIVETIDSGKAKPKDLDGFPEWLDWAKWYADSIDPCLPALPRDEYIKSPVNTPVSELEFTHKTNQIIEALNVLDSDGLFAIERDALSAISSWSWGAWSEITLVLEGLWYDISARQRY